METINTLKGYDKVGDVEKQSSEFTNPQKTRNRKLIFFFIPAITLTSLILCLTATSILHTSTTTGSNLTESKVISAVCNTTRYPESCISSLQSFHAVDAQRLFELSLKVSHLSLTNLSSLSLQLILKVNDSRVKSALRDCHSLFEDAVDNVKSSISSVEKVGPDGKVLGPVKISDISTWLSAAVTDLETCSDGLDEIGSGLHDEMVARMKNAKEYTSNSLAIIAHIGEISQKLHVPMH